MNPGWKNFLLAQNASFENDGQIVFPDVADKWHGQIYPVADLAVLTVTGKDAAKFLQGQMTCNVNDISDSQSSLGALCNPKGRVITTFLLIKDKDAFLLVIPAELLAIVQKRLQMYILRSAVVLTDCTDSLCLIGLSSADTETDSMQSPERRFAASRRENDAIQVALPRHRGLIIAEPQQAVSCWSTMTNEQHFIPGSSGLWRYLDIISGLPWLTSETSEEFIPQMLNLDTLGGISFNKGCYTGQEIVARTHYLGKAKRAMFLADCAASVAPRPNTDIIDGNTGTDDVVGKVLLAQIRGGCCKLLVILQLSDSGMTVLRLKDHGRNKINLLPL